MPTQPLWRERAVQDLSDAYLYLGAESPAAAERLMDAVDAAVRLLLDHPQAGRLRDFRSKEAADVRSWVITGFDSYVLFYRTTGTTIEIVRLLHGARDLPRLIEPD